MLHFPSFIKCSFVFVAIFAGLLLTPAARAAATASNLLWCKTHFRGPVALSPDGTLLVAALQYGAVGLYRVSDGIRLRILIGHTDVVEALAFTPDGRSLLTGSPDCSVRVWRVADGTSIRTIATNGTPVRSLAISPDGQSVAIAGAVTRTDNYYASLWRITDGTLIRTFTSLQGAKTVAYSPDGLRLAITSTLEGPSIVRIDDGSRRSLYVAGTAFAFSPDGTLLACGNTDGSIKVYRVGNLTLARTLTGHTAAITGLAFTPDGATLISAAETIKRWQVSDGTCIATYADHQGGVLGLSLSANGQVLASGGVDKTVRLWQTSDWACLRTLAGDMQGGGPVAISPNGYLVAAADADGTVKLWRTANQYLYATLTGHTGAVTTLAFSPNGGLLATGGADKTIKLWQVSTGQLLRTLPAQAGAIQSLAFVSSGWYLASAALTDRDISLWQVNTGLPAGKLSGHTETVKQLAASSDGSLLASTDNRYYLRLWRVADRSLIYNWSGAANAVFAFSADGQLLATDSYIYQVSGGAIIRTAGFNSPRAMVFTPDTQMLVGIDRDGAVHFLQLSDGSTFTGISSLNGQYTGLAITPDSRTLILAGPWGISAWRMPEYQPDLTCRAGDGAFSGNDIYHDLTAQTCRQAVSQGNAAVYRLQVQNDGNRVEPLLVRCSMPADENWTVRCFDAAEREITGEIFGTGWQTGLLLPGEACELRIEVMPDVAAPIGTEQDLIVSAASVTREDMTDQVRLSTLLRATLTGVDLAAVPAAPQPVGVEVTLVATPIGVTDVEYLFRAGYVENGSWRWTVLRGYAPSPTFTWRPDAPRDYRLVVWARETGCTLPYQAAATIAYTITPALSAVTLRTAPARDFSPTYLLTATPTGGARVEYLFRAGCVEDGRWRWQVIRGYGLSPILAWTPPAPRRYTLVVWAREAGSAQPFQVFAIAGLDASSTR